MNSALSPNLYSLDLSVSLVMERPVHQPKSHKCRIARVEALLYCKRRRKVVRTQHHFTTEWSVLMGASQVALNPLDPIIERRI